MAPNLRSSARQRTPSNASVASGSEYHASNVSMDVEDAPVDDVGIGDDRHSPVEEAYVSTRGRKVVRKSYVESSDGDQEDELDVMDQPEDPGVQATAVNGGMNREDGNEASHGRYLLRGRNRRTGTNVILSDEDGDQHVGRLKTRSADKRLQPIESPEGRRTRRLVHHPKSKRTTAKSSRRTRQNAHEQDDDDVYVDHTSSGSADADGSLDEEPPTSPDIVPEDEPEDVEPETEQDGKPYSLRQRAKINYAIPPPLEEMRAPPKPRTVGTRFNGRFGGAKRKGPGWSASGAELSRWMGAGDDSDSDFASRTPRKPYGVGAGGGLFAGNAGGAGSLFPSELAAAAGTPSNLGKVGDALLADADPLGVNQNLSFDDVGGLDEHIKSLREMTLLPLLYPEVYQNLGVTPPRGVLFHGPPGTGKTLLARALAASCRTNGKGISFFMRKGADCLSKWVGEAERQLRLLFEEARNQQPSIIFFDEIDGLAPVRSSKQDQIHASIVSTLLALMDGMDGRGQVIVIGATNRPDAIDPALRRPGRFDREFYFPLPNLLARERILKILTKKWDGWKDERGEENVKGLARLTKGYGGADLRALCTEAALNAVQREYPQIYRSNDRLLLDPDRIRVQLRDFMLSIKKLVPSSARSTAPSTSPLAIQLIPLLQDAVDRTRRVIENVLPANQKRSALEEAEWEESEEGALEREMLLQSMESLRVYRPRVLLHGPTGMGQAYVAAAALHSLEGYYVHNLDLGTLMGDSTRTVEAAIVQLFADAKRNQPSVLYIPSLLGWCTALSDTAKMTMHSMLDSLSPTDPILLVGVVDGPISSLPPDVLAWFGSFGQNRVELLAPSAQRREEFFKGVVDGVRRPPSQYPDGMVRKKRILEELPIAPPPEPRAPSAVELQIQEESDQRVITLLKFRLGPILTELKRKFKRFTKRAIDEYGVDPNLPVPVQPIASTTVVPSNDNELPNGATTGGDEPNSEGLTGINEEPAEMQIQVQPQLFDMDLERMNIDLYKSKYLTPSDFLDDIRKIVHNATVRAEEDPERLFRAQAMLTAAEVSVQDFDHPFRLECERMASRERKRREEFRRSKRTPVDENNSIQVYPPGTRRSARHNGLEPELSITDPLQLERKLKRQRSAEVAIDSHEEGSMVGRTTKRFRSDDVETPKASDESPNSPQPQRLHVRFSNEPNDTADTNHTSPDPQPTDAHRPPVGFSELLNPIPLETSPSCQPQAADTADTGSSLPSLEYPVADTLPAPVSPTLSSDQQNTLDMRAQSSSEVAMILDEVEVQPVLELDDEALRGLTADLRDGTEGLSIEELEHLRATCLQSIWLHRKEWNKTSLVLSLKNIVRDFTLQMLSS
ncbi:hypothetical protein C8Q75DRAFT_721352 [Abortiporus biennis]|nr:hypothetical protein C8Q75DRAFT_721352 [Abortiporus biennis]